MGDPLCDLGPTCVRNSRKKRSQDTTTQLVRRWFVSRQGILRGHWISMGVTEAFAVNMLVKWVITGNLFWFSACPLKSNCSIFLGVFKHAPWGLLTPSWRILDTKLRMNVALRIKIGIWFGLTCRRETFSMMNLLHISKKALWIIRLPSHVFTKSFFAQ